MKFSKYLKSINESLNNISKKCNIPYATLHSQVNNPSKMNLENFIKLCTYLDIDSNTLTELLLEEEYLSLLSILKDQLDSKLKGNLYHFTQIDFAYNTNRIEGSVLSMDQTRSIYETNTIGMLEESTNIDDLIETTNSFHLFDYMLKTANNILSEKLIKKYHKLLKSNTKDSFKDWNNIGDYKLLPNEVSNKETTHPKDVKSKMNQLLDNYNKIEVKTLEDIIDFHYQFEAIHPFQDGNGRIGRIIMFKECLKNNVVPFIIEDSKKKYYYKGLNNYKQVKGYLVDTCLSMQDEYIKQIKHYLSTFYNVDEII